MPLLSMFMLALLGMVIASQAITAQADDRLMLSAGEATYLLDGPPTRFSATFSVDINTRPFDFAYGDIDDDGLLDRLLVSPNFVGTPGGPSITPLLAGVAFVAFGSPSQGVVRSGPISSGHRIIPPTTWGTATTVAVGDLNRDGIDDVVIGASAWRDDPATGRALSGQVSIVFGPIVRPEFGPLNLQLSKTPADASITSSDPDRGFGWWTRIGDITGDGVNDLLVGAAFEPRIYVYAGPIAPGEYETMEADFILEDRQRFPWQGAFEVIDMTGDGVPDLIVSNRFTFDDFPSPSVRVIEGPLSGPGVVNIEEEHILIIEGPRETDFGSGLAAADLNSDGEMDLLIGDAHGGARSEGIVYVLHGPLRSGHVEDLSSIQLIGERADDTFGASIDASDLTGDGVPDVTILASDFDIGPITEDENVGRLYIFEGSPPSIGEVRTVNGNLEILGQDLVGLVTLDGVPADVLESSSERLLIRGTGNEVRVIGIFGSASALVEQSVELLPGWNLIGYTGAGPVAELTSPIANRVSALFSWDAPAQSFLGFRPSAPVVLNTLDELEPFSGVWINISDGPPVSWRMPAVQGARNIPLKSGFNLVMWTGPESAVSDAIASIAPTVRSLFLWDPIADAFLRFSPSAPSVLNTAETLRPGQGVWISVSRDVGWTQPATASDGGSPETPAPEGAVPTTPVAESVSEAEQAIVLIRTPEGSGSGFVVSDTEILTNAHVVVGFDQVDLVFVGGAVRSGAVKTLDLELDVAVVEVVGLPAGVLRIDWQSAEQPTPSTPVWTWGFPFGQFAGVETSATVAVGVVSAIQTNGAFSFIQTDAAVNAGNSGGPLIIEDGRAVGINSFILVAQGQDVEGLNFAIDIAIHRDRIQGLLGTPAATPAPGASAADGRIAFGSDRNGSFDIYVVNPDGTDLTRLTSGPGNDNGPMWSPSGSRILFYSDRDGDTELYVMNADGSGQTRLTESPDLDWLGSWSPDGSQIAFTTNRNGNPDIYLMNADGSDQRPLVVGPSIEAVPDWSPDGSLIVFHSDRSADARNVFVMKSDGSEITQLTTSVGNDWIARWSPDGTQIVFSSDRDGNSEIYVMNRDGGGQTNLSQNPSVDYWPTWSPDGTWVAFRSDRAGAQNEIYVMRADGSVPTRLTFDPDDDRFPSWSVDTAMETGFIVDSTADRIDASPGDGLCRDDRGKCTLRAAVMEANARAGSDEIRLPAGTFILTLVGADEDASQTGDLDVTDDLRISGEGAAATVIDAARIDRVFHIFPAKVEISGVTIQNGIASGELVPLPELRLGVWGGGIFNLGALTVTDSIIRDNQASGRGGGIMHRGGTLLLVRSTVEGNSVSSSNEGGGGIYNESRLSVVDSVIRGNTSDREGGGIMSRAPATIVRSTISGNTGLYSGGIFNWLAGGDPTLVIHASTISLNTGGIAGGLMNSGGNVTLINSTISSNTSNVAGGVHHGPRGTVEIYSSTIANNSGGEAGGLHIEGLLRLANTLIAENGVRADCVFRDAGTVVSLGHNLDSDGSCTLSAPTDLPGRDPALGALRSNGGPTQTHALLSGSPAIDAIPLTACIDDIGARLPEDQRGNPRPFGAACDVGAYEAGIP